MFDYRSNQNLQITFPYTTQFEHFKWKYTERNYHSEEMLFYTTYIYTNVVFFSFLTFLSPVKKLLNELLTSS